jgi:lysyl-tRNA synthetase class 2
MYEELENSLVPTWQRIRSGQASAASRLRRAEVTDATRAFFKLRGFREVETPLFVRFPGMEPYLDVFETRWRTPSGDDHAGFLTTSPEYAMKKLLAAGIAPIFQICKSFRNGEGIGSRHNPEFTILEWYRRDADYTTIMDDCEELFRFVAGELSPQRRRGHWQYQGRILDLDGPWERLTVAEAFERFAGIDLWSPAPGLIEVAATKGYSVDESTSWEQAFNQIFLNEIEPRLGQERPTFLHEYPISMAALSRPSPTDPRVAERFELYVAGIEMANAFSELTDADEQLRRLRAEQEERRALGKTWYDVDADFIRALATGLPECAGIALGIDRMVMFFADVASIRDVLWFPADEIFA